MMIYSHTIGANKKQSCDECGNITRLRVYKVAEAQDVFDSAKHSAICERCEKEECDANEYEVT